MSQIEIKQNPGKKEISSMDLSDRYVVFRLDEQKFAIPVSLVNRIIRSVNITPIPGTPERINGIINVHGDAVPVFDLRKLFSLPARKIQLSDNIFFVNTSSQLVAFAADEVIGVTDRSQHQKINARMVLPGLEEKMEGLVFFEDGITLIYQLDDYFSFEADKSFDLVQLKKALDKARENFKNTKHRKPTKKVVAQNRETEKK